MAEEAELACLVLLDGARWPLPLLLRSSEATRVNQLLLAELVGLSEDTLVQRSTQNSHFGTAFDSTSP